MGLKETLSAAFLTLAVGAAEPAGAAETQAVMMTTRSALQAQAERLKQTAQGAGAGSSGVLPLEQK